MQFMKSLKLFCFKKKKVFINNESLDYPNFFINIKGHNLEELVYKEIFKGFDIKMWSHDLINSFEKNGVFIPDDLVRVYRILNNNVYLIKLESFEYQIFNSNDNWFIRFTTKEDTCLEDLKFLNALVINLNLISFLLNCKI